MMRFVYILVIQLYTWLLAAISIFHGKARKMVAGRRQTFKMLQLAIKPGDKVIWFHAASLGEFEQGRPVLERIKEILPGRKILLTFYSPSGYEVRKNFSGADIIVYLPADTWFLARRFLRMVQPERAFFIKYEFWYNYLSELKRANTPTYLVSGIFRPDQSFFRWYGRPYRRLLWLFDRFFVQDEQSATLLAAIGIQHVVVSGDTRFDRVAAIAEADQQVMEAAIFSDGYQVVVCGSTWPEDEALLIQFIHESSKDTRFIIAPHEVDQKHVNELCGKLRCSYLRFSEVDEDKLRKAKVLIVDTIGLLSALYKYGELAYIGGGFGVGIHNTLEAVAAGVPVVFGPNYHKFCEAHELIALGAARSIVGFGELKCAFQYYLSDKERLRKAGQEAGHYIQQHRGATERILSSL